MPSLIDSQFEIDHLSKAFWRYQFSSKKRIYTL